MFPKDAIMELVNKGIINGKGDGKFEIADYAFQWVRSGVSPSNLLIPSLLKANLSKPHPKNGPPGRSFFLHQQVPDMFPGIGLLLPLGYGQGPGQAYSIGSRWEALGLQGGGNLGLTIAGFGFIWAVIPGIILMNFLIRHPKFKQAASRPLKERTEVTEKSEEGEIPLSDAIDKLTYQIALIGFIYLVTYLTLRGLEAVLTPLGIYGETLAQLLIGFHFLIGSLYAMLFRWILNRWKQSIRNFSRIRRTTWSWAARPQLCSDFHCC